MRIRTGNYRKRGQSLITVVAASGVLILLGLLALDLVTLTISSSINTRVAKEAARAAANQQTRAQAQAAAQKAILSFKKSSIITQLQLEAFDYQNDDQVSVQTRMQVSLPAPIPGLKGTVLLAQAVETVVGTPAEL